MPTISIFGAGSWGTALAMQLARRDTRVVLWARDPEQLSAMAASGINERYLPGFPLPSGIDFEPDLAAAARAGDHLLLVTPSHAFADLLRKLAPHLRPGQGVAWAAKGFEPGSGRLLHEVAAEILGPGHPGAVVTGPSFAREVAADQPTAVTVASEDEAFAEVIAAALHGGSFRAYTGSDVVGAELGGAVKNVLAVATGICDGMGLGDNARAALITRGLAELMRLGQAMGAEPATLTGLAGMGDLVLTCTGDLSRNRRLGLALGQGQTVDQAVAGIGQVVEGIGAAREVRRLAREHGVDMPIARQVCGIIHEGWNPREGLRRLLAREQKAELEGLDSA